MKEWHILYAYFEGGPLNFVVLDSFFKVLIWFVRTGRRCTDIKIFTDTEA